MERQTGRTPDGLVIPPIPFIFERPMLLWRQIHRGRSLGALGLVPLSWQDIHAFCQMTGEWLSPGDLEAVWLIDSEFVASHTAAADHRAKSRGD